MLCHYALDRVPLHVLRSAWTTGGGPRAQWGEELLRLLHGTTGDPRIKPEEDGEVPVVVAAATAGETSWTLERKLVIGAVVAMGSSVAGLLLDLPLPSFLRQELDGPGDLLALLVVYVFWNNLWLVGWGVHYLGRALGPSTYRGRVRGRVVRAVDQYDYDLDDNTLNTTVYPMVTVHYVVKGQAQVGVFGDPDNQTLRDLAVVMGTSKDWEAGYSWCRWCSRSARPTRTISRRDGHIANAAHAMGRAGHVGANHPRLQAHRPRHVRAGCAR